MTRLHKSDPGRFVRPFALLDRAQGGITPYRTEDTIFCTQCVCIVMEKGVVNMKEYFSKRLDMPILEK